MKTAKDMGIATVAIYSDADAGSKHVQMADEAVHVGGAASADSYLQGQRIIDAALATGAKAIHPGFGFLSENADLLIYGCNFAEGQVGENAADTLANLTGADIAASDDLTGHASLGGDWDLEYRSGEIDKNEAFQQLLNRPDPFASQANPSDYLP